MWSGLPAAQRALLVALADHLAGDDGAWVYPAQDLLAELTGGSEQTVRRATRALVDAGVLRVRRRPRPHHRSYEYQIAWGAVRDLGAARRVAFEAARAARAEDGSPYRLSGDTVSPDTVSPDNLTASPDKVVGEGPRKGPPQDPPCSPPPPPDPGAPTAGGPPPAPPSRPPGQGEARAVARAVHALRQADADHVAEVDRRRREAAGAASRWSSPQVHHPAAPRHPAPAVHRRWGELATEATATLPEYAVDVLDAPRSVIDGAVVLEAATPGEAELWHALVLGDLAELAGCPVGVMARDADGVADEDLDDVRRPARRAAAGDQVFAASLLEQTSRSRRTAWVVAVAEALVPVGRELLARAPPSAREHPTVHHHARGAAT